MMPTLTAMPCKSLPHRTYHTQHCQPELKAAMDLIADPSNHPLMFHCEYGKDRTGIIAALILVCAGVNRESIVKDYVQSEDYTRSSEYIREVQLCLYS